MKQIKNVLAVAGLAAILATGAFAQRYTPPSGGSTSNNTSNNTSTNTGTTTTPKPTQQNPDPFGLTLAASGAAAAVGYVMRRKRGAS